MTPSVFVVVVHPSVRVPRGTRQVPYSRAGGIEGSRQMTPAMDAASGACHHDDSTPSPIAR
jgi:hypothetical protein